VAEINRQGSTSTTLATKQVEKSFNGGSRLDCARDTSLDTKVITKHHRTKEKKTHTKPFLCCCFFCFFLLFSATFFDNLFVRGTSKLNRRTKMLLMSN
jgi:hypothetical protein